MGRREERGVCTSDSSRAGLGGAGGHLPEKPNGARVQPPDENSLGLNVLFNKR